MTTKEYNKFQHFFLARHGKMKFNKIIRMAMSEFHSDRAVNDAIMVIFDDICDNVPVYKEEDAFVVAAAMWYWNTYENFDGHLTSELENFVVPVGG